MAEEFTFSTEGGAVVVTYTATKTWAELMGLTTVAEQNHLECEQEQAALAALNAELRREER